MITRYDFVALVLSLIILAQDAKCQMSTIYLTVSEGQAVPRDWSCVNDYKPR